MTNRLWTALAGVLVAVVIVVVIVIATGGDSKPSAASASAQIEHSLEARMGGIANCVELDDGSKYQCVLTTDNGLQQMVDVNCGDDSASGCIYNAKP